MENLLALVKEYAIDMWEVILIQETMLYPALISVLSWGPEGYGPVDGGQRRGKFGKFSHLGREFSHSGKVTGKLFITDDLPCVRYVILALLIYSVCGGLVNGINIIIIIIINTGSVQGCLQEFAKVQVFCYKRALHIQE